MNGFILVPTRGVLVNSNGANYRHEPKHVRGEALYAQKKKRCSDTPTITPTSTLQ